MNISYKKFVFAFASVLCANAKAVQVFNPYPLVVGIAVQDWAEDTMLKMLSNFNEVIAQRFDEYVINEIKNAKTDIQFYNIISEFDVLKKELCKIYKAQRTFVQLFLFTFMTFEEKAAVLADNDDLNSLDRVGLANMLGVGLDVLEPLQDMQLRLIIAIERKFAFLENKTFEEIAAQGEVFKKAWVAFLFCLSKRLHSDRHVPGDIKNELGSEDGRSYPFERLSAYLKEGFSEAEQEFIQQLDIALFR